MGKQEGPGRWSWRSRDCGQLHVMPGLSQQPPRPPLQAHFTGRVLHVCRGPFLPADLGEVQLLSVLFHPDPRSHPGWPLLLPSQESLAIAIIEAIVLTPALWPLLLSLLRHGNDDLLEGCLHPEGRWLLQGQRWPSLLHRPPHFSQPWFLLLLCGGLPQEVSGPLGAEVLLCLPWLTDFAYRRMDKYVSVGENGRESTRRKED